MSGLLFIAFYRIRPFSASEKDSLRALGRAFLIKKRAPASVPSHNFLSEAAYNETLQGDFYGADYYRHPTSEIDSAIIYDDNEDKRATAAFIALNFGPRRVLEVGCAMGLLVKALRGHGVEAEGVDFSGWCVGNAHPAVKNRVRRGDVLDLASPAVPYDAAACRAQGSGEP